MLSGRSGRSRIRARGAWEEKGSIKEFAVYQEKGIHSALGYSTPTKFDEKWYREPGTVVSLSKNGRKTVQLSGHL